MTFEVIVAGAGPAGAALANALAREGVRVLLVDPLRPLYHKIGESMPGAALPLLRALSLPVPVEGGPHRKIRGNSSCWGSAELQYVDFLFQRDGPSWRLDRLKFDADLRAAAVASGVSLVRASIDSATRKRATWSVEFSDGQFAKARWLVDATGRRAAVARLLGVPRQRDEPLVAVYAISRPAEKSEFDRTLVEATASGWWYAAWLPQGAALAAFHVTPRDAARLKREPAHWLHAYAKTRYVRAMLAGARFAEELHAADAAGARLEQFAGPGWLACGDAALSFDPLSAQGIYFALFSARCAAQVIGVGARSPAAYIDEIEAFREIYLERWREVHRAESRWPLARFWAERRRHSSAL
jgi:flavin-dependent dehydrogenase